MKSIPAGYLIFVCAVLVLLFNYPLMEMANKQQKVSGWPLLPCYLFAVWALSIVALYFLSKRLFKSKKENE